MIPQSDTVWAKTPFANLYRYKDGKYHCRAKVCGRLVRKSLGTSSIEIAKAKMDELLVKERSRAEIPADDDLTLERLAKDWIETVVKANHKLKPRAIGYRQETLDGIIRHCPEAGKARLRSVDGEDLKSWATVLRGKYSGTRYNGCVETLRGIFDLAVKRGLLLKNPAMEIERVSVPIRTPDLMPDATYKLFLAELGKHPRRKSALALVRFMACTGARIGAASRVTLEHVDFKRNEIVLPLLKYDERPVRVPILPQLAPLLRQLIAKTPAGVPLFQKSAKTALRTCAKNLEIVAPTHHFFRHLFCTRCIEAGVDVRTVAAWLGHKDGGALLLKRYAHLRDEHSQRMSRRVKI